MSTRLTPYQSKYVAWLLSRRMNADSADMLAATLVEKLHRQKRRRELEDKCKQLRRRIFDWQDEIAGQRNRLIEELESRLSRQMQKIKVFAIQQTNHPSGGVAIICRIEEVST